MIRERERELGLVAAGLALADTHTHTHTVLAGFRGRLLSGPVVPAPAAAAGQK